MRKMFKNFASIFLVPLTQWYLQKKRRYTFRGTIVTVLPGVFHPGIFHSTVFILKYLEQQPLAGKTLLEIGSGTGLISIRAAKANALVTATDLSPIAIGNTTLNAQLNHAKINIIQSDLFTQLEKEIFDWIVINPPYYARKPQSESDLAWYCGENFEYFEKLFDQLKDYTSAKAQVIIVLTKGCDLQKIFQLGRQRSFEFELIRENKVLFDEKDFLYRIRPKAFDLPQA